ncbi:MAG: cobyrinate a,c-diamide synthase [Actinomycetota bacterium]|nr:cobyrinate a,c-diamide synthase [Actinomycetota bacterium]
MKREIPRLVIAGTKSGCGKTSISVGLTVALYRLGLRVQTFKVGPDYLDPTWLSLASGRPCYNLDTWMAGQDYVKRLFDRTIQGADIAVIEGVMGLFDGANTSGLSASTAEIAKILKAPILLVVNASGMGPSLAPLVLGFSKFLDGVEVRGVIANMVGSDRHVSILEEALDAVGAPPLIGAISKDGLPSLGSRHLGLVAPLSSKGFSKERLLEFAVRVEGLLNLDKIIEIAKSAPRLSSSFEGEAAETWHRSISSPMIAVAKDEAFHFYYQDLFDEMRERGVDIQFFSPLQDDCMPAAADALYIGGGYPEAHAKTLSENLKMLESIRDFSAKKRPIYAECGGLIYLSSHVTTAEGERYPLLGLLAAETRISKRLRRLGYVKAVLKEECILGSPGNHLLGHEFHYGELASEPPAKEGWIQIYDDAGGRDLRPETGELSPKGYYHKERRILTSFVHLHLASNPMSLCDLIQSALLVKNDGLCQV